MLALLEPRPIVIGHGVATAMYLVLSEISVVSAGVGRWAASGFDELHPIVCEDELGQLLAAMSIH